MASTPKPARASGPPVDQRKWVRHACSPEVACHLQGGPGFDFWAVRVQNVSLGGINLILDRIVPSGKVVPVELHHRGRGFSCQRQMRVIYNIQDPRLGLVAGGAFSQELTDQEIRGLL